MGYLFVAGMVGALIFGMNHLSLNPEKAKSKDLLRVGMGALASPFSKFLSMGLTALGIAEHLIWVIAFSVLLVLAAMMYFYGRRSVSQTA